MTLYMGRTSWHDQALHNVLSSTLTESSQLLYKDMHRDAICLAWHRREKAGACQEHHQVMMFYPSGTRLCTPSPPLALGAPGIAQGFA
jgi:hypothetical protein